MSLINEALKRAKQVQAQPAVPTAADPALQPAIYTASSLTRANWLIAAGGVVILLIAAWFLSLWWRGTNLQAKTPTPVSVAAQAKPVAAPATHTALAPIQPAASTVPAPTHPTNAVEIVKRADETAAPAPVATNAATVLSHTSGPVPTTAPAPATAQKTNETLPQPLPVVSASPMPEMKVQGIFYRAAKSSALVNGQTVFVGSTLR